MTNSLFAGIIAYTITPFDDSTEQINLEVMYQVIDNLLDSGADAIAALGSAGECAYLNDQEWELVAEKTINHVAKRAPVIIGISELTTKKALERAAFAKRIGADAIMVSPFSYYKLTEDEIFTHYQTISNTVSIPIMVYNNPATCGVDMTPKFMLEMIEKIEHAQMIKESSGDIERMHMIKQYSNGTVPFFNGCNYIALEALKAGAQGWCTVAPSLIGNLPKRLFEAVKSKDKQIATALFEKQLPLLTFIVNHGLAASVKSGLGMNNVNAGSARLPLKPLPENQLNELRIILSNIKR